ncbi:MAG: heme-copper oxidase subunit III [Deltaproteobacteria bacterium]
MGEHTEAHAAAGHAPVWHTSVWPLILSVGILFLLPLAFAAHFVYKSSMLSYIFLGIGAPLTIISIAGWVKEGMTDEHGYGEGHSVWAMPIFIVSEALLFFGFFAAYWVLRLSASSWPPAGTPEISLILPIIMTVVLLSSSVTIHFAEERMDHDDHGGFVRWLVITMILGGAFLGMSVYEWTGLFREGFNPSTNVYSTSFFSITGFHGSHVIVGLGMFLCVLLPAFSRKVSKPFVRAASIYWHFVDIVWLFVVSQMYFW